jgi:EmrB/QacA subfamily drug resistance transporter
MTPNDIPGNTVPRELVPELSIPRAPASGWRVLAIVSVGVFMAGLDLFIVNIAFPDLQRDFGASLASLSWILNAYAIVFAALLVPAGRLSDRAGRKRGFLGGLSLFVAASALCAAAPSVETLVAARVFQAAGAAFMLPTSLGLLLPEFPPSQRATAVGAWAAVGGVAAAAGPPIGGLLVEASWRLVFLVNVPVGLVTLVIAARALREHRDPDQRLRPDLVGAAALAVGIASLVLGIVKGPDWGWGSAQVVASFAASLALVALFVRRSARHPAPVVELPMLRVRSFAVANVAALLFFAAFSAMVLAGVIFLTSVWHYSILEAGLRFSPGPLMAAAFSAPAGALGDRFGQRLVGAPGALIFAAGCAWWAWQVGATPDYAGELLPGLLVTGMGVGLTIPSISSAAAASLPPSRFATGVAVLTMSRQIGAALGVAILVVILGTATGAGALDDFQKAWAFMATAAVGASLACLALGRVRVTGTEPAAGVEPSVEPAAEPEAQRTLTISWDDPLASADSGHSLGGLDHLRAIAGGELPPPPIAKLLGLSLVEVEDGRAVFAAEPGEQHYNPIGVVHGGLAATLLDSAMGCAVQSTLAAGVAYTTLELKVNFVRPMTHETGRVIAEATVVHRGGTVATAEGRVVAEETGKLIAHGTTTCLVMSQNGNGKAKTSSQVGPAAIRAADPV